MSNKIVGYEFFRDYSRRSTALQFPRNFPVEIREAMARRQEEI